jgi:exonuclease III
VKGRKQCVMDTIRNHDLDFIGIQETKTKKLPIT